MSTAFNKGKTSHVISHSLLYYSWVCVSYHTLWRAEYTHQNVETKPALFRATTPSKLTFHISYHTLFVVVVVNLVVGGIYSVGSLVIRAGLGCFLVSCPGYWVRCSVTKSNLIIINTKLSWVFCLLPFTNHYYSNPTLCLSVVAERLSAPSRYTCVLKQDT